MSVLHFKCSTAEKAAVKKNLYFAFLLLFHCMIPSSQEGKLSYFVRRVGWDYRGIRAWRAWHPSTWDLIEGYLWMEASSSQKVIPCWILSYCVDSTP